MEFLEKVKAVVIGHAVGDALGVPVEFASREELDKAPAKRKTLQVLFESGFSGECFSKVYGAMPKD